MESKPANYLSVFAAGEGEAKTKGVFLTPHGLSCVALCFCALPRILPIQRSYVGKKHLGS